MIDNVRKSLDQIGVRAGFERGTLHATAFKHSYITARLYTSEHGAPVSLWTVRGEVGHSSTQMIETVYGHEIKRRDRAFREDQHGPAEEVSFRIEDYREKLGDRLLAFEAAND